ncbi:MAG TPA: hypothetical protein VD731_03095 [Nitrosopumilaceae archaeon]|nr:hypothetical protein [Nitrosopumilaceae archaeon]
MGEIEEFAEALLDQLSVEINEEKEIAELFLKIKEDSSFNVKFEDLETICQRIFPSMAKKIEEFFGIPILPLLKLEYLELKEFKKMKGRKVFSSYDSKVFVDELFEAIADQDIKKIAVLIKKDPAKFLVYSTYAKSYISKISTTYGDFLDSAIYLNKFILGSYPQIILYKQGPPYESRFESVRSGYNGALKMTILEEQIHSLQQNLHDINKKAVIEVNAINEELAKIILSLDDSTTETLTEYLKLQPVPDDFPTAKRANLFFMLNPDNFIVSVLGPDVMTYTKVEIDPKISEMIPQLLGIYQRWLKPIQTHHAVFTIMEGMAEYAVQNILKDDADFQNYLTTFMGTDISSYQVRKSMGRDFTKIIYEKHGKETFKMLIENPPSTLELKDPQRYLARIK